jgi:hypothetical protein
MRIYRYTWYIRVFKKVCNWTNTDKPMEDESEFVLLIIDNKAADNRQTVVGIGVVVLRTVRTNFEERRN